MGILQGHRVDDGRVRQGRGARGRRLVVAVGLVLGLAAGFATLAAWGEEDRTELVGERTVYTKTFDYGDGSIAVQTAPEPLHYGSPGSEEMLDIDPSLIEDGGWHNDTNSFPTELPEALGDGSAVRLGQDLGVAWRPGRLWVRLISGREVEVADPSVVFGVVDEEVPNAILYRDLYPGLDLRLEVRPGALFLEMEMHEWLVGFEPEQVDGFFVDGELELAPELLEVVEERGSEGEPLEEIPLYLGRSGDSFVLTVVSDPGVPEPQLEEYEDALRKQPGGPSAPAPSGWMSSLGEWLATGRIRHYFRYLTPTLGSGFGVGVAESALMASFKFEAKTELFERRFFSPMATSLSGVKIAHKDTLWGPRYPYTLGRIEVGRGTDASYRSVVTFRGMKDVKQRLQALGAWQIETVWLGTEDQHYLPRGGVVAIDSDGIVASRVLPWILSDYTMKLRDSDHLLEQPYSLTTRPISGGSLETGTWDFFANTGYRWWVFNGDSFSFGPLSNTAPGASVPRAISDLTKVLTEDQERLPLGLALPQDRVSCVPCTAAHPDPAVQALNGEYRVGAGFYNLRLEIKAKGIVSHQATVSVSSVGGHNDELYPGESLDWDLELTAKSAGAGDLDLAEQSWKATDGVIFSFRDPANPGTVIPNPKLSAIGDKVRLRATWQRAEPSLYSRVQDLLIDGYFGAIGGLKSGQVKIPIKLKAPSGQPTFQQIASVFDDDVSSGMYLTSYGLPAQARGSSLGEARLRWSSGPTAKLQRGVHWDLRSYARPGNDGDLVIYPDRFKPGMYTVQLDPCLLPDGYPAPLYCCAAALRHGAEPGLRHPGRDEPADAQARHRFRRVVEHRRSDRR